MTSASNEFGGELAALVAVARDYFDGMMYADEAKLRRAFHPKCLIVGHFRGRLEYDPLESFIAACKAEGSIPPGAPYYAEIVSIDVTGDTAVVKVIDDYLGSRFTDYLTDGRWVIVNKCSTCIWSEPARSCGAHFVIRTALDFRSKVVHPELTIVISSISAILSQFFVALPNTRPDCWCAARRRGSSRLPRGGWNSVSWIGRRHQRRAII